MPSGGGAAGGGGGGGGGFSGGGGGGAQGRPYSRQDLCITLSVAGIIMTVHGTPSISAPSNTSCCTQYIVI